MPTIGFIGGGNMAASLIGGLIKAGFAATDIVVAEPDAVRRQFLSEQYRIAIDEDNAATLSCDIIVLAVKPQLLKTVCQQLNATIDNNSLFVSIAAGVRSTDIARWLLADQPQTDPSGKKETTLPAIVRCMPNTPALLQCGASGLYANTSVNDTQKQQAEQILQAVGIVIWVEDEQQLDAVTAVSGSGPAYFFLMMEAMQNAGEQLGLSADISRQLVLQTALGASRMASESEFSAAELRQKVTSKGGTTEQAIRSLQDAHYQQIILQALRAANDRSISLADELGSD
jgi:pyrroline-5-carboxylate reductase